MIILGLIVFSLVHVYLLGYMSHFLQLLNKMYTSLEWALNSPPKPHAFTSLPLQSGLKVILINNGFCNKLKEKVLSPQF